MSDTIQYQNFPLRVFVNKKLKHSYIRVKTDGVVEVKTPHSSEHFVYRFIEEKKSWIQKQLANNKLLEFRSEDRFDLDYISKRLEYFSHLMGLSYSEVRFKTMKSQWGSCNTQRKITLNTQLKKLDSEMIDYVLVHELAHLVHMNHSKSFHALVGQYLPNAKEIRKSMKNIKI